MDEPEDLNIMEAYLAVAAQTGTQPQSRTTALDETWILAGSAPALAPSVEPNTVMGVLLVNVVNAGTKEEHEFRIVLTGRGRQTLAETLQDIADNLPPGYKFAEFD